jgi:hypothetical protein
MARKDQAFTQLAAGQDIAQDAPIFHKEWVSWHPAVIAGLCIIVVQCSDMMGYVQYECSWGTRTKYTSRIVKEVENPGEAVPALPRQLGLTDPHV